MVKPGIIAVIFVGAFVSVNSLQCYYCEDCPTSNLKDSHLVTCGNETSTSAPDSNTTTLNPVSPSINGSTNNNTIPSTNGTVPATPRVRRDIDNERDLGCICYGIECNCDKDGAVLKAAHYANVTYVCASATVKGPNRKDIIIRGCGEPTICTHLPEKMNITDCKTCTTDKCNSAYMTQHSLVPLLFLLTSVLITNI